MGGRMSELLDVYCFGETAGSLTDERPMRFEYSREWIEGGRPPISQSLPLDGRADPEAATAFFGGLLPEGVPRRLIARSSGISEGNDFALLAELGWDCAGAVSVYRHGQPPLPDGNGDDVKWLNGDELAQVIDELPRRPMLFDDDGEVRLSLAGAQDKLPVVVGSDGRIGLGGRRSGTGRGTARTPSTHILKLPIERLEGTVVNEAFALSLLNRIGANAVEASPRTVNGRQFLLVRRYDRRAAGAGSSSTQQRLHQEDFCQALGVPSDRKYESEGGPGQADCFDLIRRASGRRAPDVTALLDAAGFNFLIGNHDAHGKNFSLLYTPQKAQLAPFYDVLSSFVYRSSGHNMDRKLAMKIGGENRWDYVRRRHWDRFFEEAGLGVFPSRRRLLDLCDRTTRAARDVRNEFAAAGWDDPLLDSIIELIDLRAAAVLAELASQ